MINTEKLSKYILDFEIPKKIQKRELKLPETPYNIIALVGARRTGKSYSIFHLIRKLKLERSEYVYIDFEDSRLLDIDVDDLEVIFENKKLKYIFLDEVQVLQNWANFVRRIDNTKKYHLYITGSSSKLLSTEIATNLRGRTETINVFPFNLFEYQKSQNKSLEEFFVDGGLPESWVVENKSNYLDQYVDSILLKDILERYQVKEISELRNLVQFLISNSSGLFSVKSYYDKVKSSSSISRITVADYYEYIKNSLLIKESKIFSSSLSKQKANPKKIYVLDHALIDNVSLVKEDSKKFETLVFNQLLQMGFKNNYYRGIKEVDIVASKKNIHIPIQVCFEINSKETLQREIEGLLDFVNQNGFLNTSQGFIVVYKGSKKKEIVYELGDFKIYKIGIEDVLKNLTTL